MDEILIEKVRQHEVLYNHSSRDYRDQFMRQEAWEEIGRELKISADKAKQMWDKLRRCYNNARNRRLSTKSGQATKNIPAWKYEQQMSFLLPYLEGRRTCSNLVSDVEDIADLQESENIAEAEITHTNAETKVSQDSAETEFLDAGDQGEPQVERNENTSREDMQQEKNMQSLEKVKKRKQCTKTTNPAAELVHIMQENANLRKRKYEYQEENKAGAKKSPLLEHMHDIDLFFLSMAKITKKLPKYEQTSVKLAVSNAVLQAEQRSLETQPYYFPQTSVPAPLISALSSSSMQSACSSQNYLGHESKQSSNCENDRRPTLLELSSINDTNFILR